MDDTNLKSTKFILSVLGLVLTFSALVMKLVDAEMFRDVVYATVGLYSFANVAQKVFAPTPTSTVTSTTTVTSPKASEVLLKDPQ